MGKPKSKEQKYYDEVLKSILAPVAYSGGVIRNTEALNTVDYQVPKGMTEEQAMLVTLGAMLDEEILFNTASASSPGSYRRMEWLQKFLVRDYLKGDENRGLMFGEAMVQGRQNAKEAFDAFANGDSSKVNAMLKRAVKVINRVYSETEIRDDSLWFTLAATKHLMDDAFKNVKEEVLSQLNISISPEKSIFENEVEQRKLCLEKLENKDLSEDERNELILEALVHSEIVHDYNEYDFSGNQIIQDLYPEDQYINDNFNKEKSTAFMNVAKHYVEEFKKTHPSTLVYKMKTEEGRQEVYQHYRKIISKRLDYQAACKKGTIPEYLNAKIILTNHLSDNEQAKYGEDWKKLKEECKNELNIAYEKALNYNNDLSENLNKIAKEKGIHQMVVLGGDLIKERNSDLGNVVMDQKELYLVGDDYEKIYRVYSENGYDFQVKQVVELPNDPSSGTFNAMHMHINETLPLLRDNLTLSKSFHALQNEDNIAEIGNELNQLTDLMKASLLSYSKDVNQEITQKATALIETAKNTHSENTNVTRLISNIQSFAKRVLEAEVRAEQRTEQFTNKFVESKNRANGKRLEHKEEELTKRASIMGQCAELEKKAKGKAIGNRNTMVKNGLSNYMEAIQDKISNNKALTDQFSKFLSALNNLNTRTDTLYQRDVNGKYPLFQSIDQKNLLSDYNAALSELTKLKKVMESNTQFSELSEICSSLQKMLGADVTTLTGVAINGEQSLADVVEAGHTIRVDVSNKTFSTVGANANTRLAMSVVRGGKEVKGFFTVEKKHEISASDVQHIKDLAVDLKVMFPKVSDLVDKAIDRTIEKKSLDGVPSILQHIEQMLNENPNLITAENYDSVMEEINDAYMTDFAVIGNPKLKELEAFYKKLATNDIQYSMGIGAVEGTSLPGRNVAMSKVANLLQISGLIANSVKMELSDENGKIVKGVFMDNAQGIDHDKIMPEDVKNCTEKCGDNPSLLKSISELQILDYICGNVDRHQNNFFYQFNEDKTQLIGIQGIDNDLSFGSKILDDNPNQLKPQETLLSNIEVISEKMGQRILNTDESMLKLSLADTGISETEIQTAVDRLNIIKGRIQDKKIALVPDSRWKDYTLGDLDKEFTLFHQVNNQVKILPKIAQDNLEKALKAKENSVNDPNKKKFGFEKVNYLDGINQATLKKDSERIDAFAATMEASQKKIWGSGSPEFRNLQGAMSEYNSLIKNFGDNPSSVDYLKAQAKLESIVDLSKVYLDSKEGVSLNKNGKERYQLVQNIQEFSAKRLTEFKGALHHKDEIEVEEMNATLKAQAQKISEKEKRMNGVYGKSMAKKLSKMEQQQKIFYTEDGKGNISYNQSGLLNTFYPNSKASHGYDLNFPLYINLRVYRDMIVGFSGLTKDPEITSSAETFFTNGKMDNTFRFATEAVFEQFYKTFKDEPEKRMELWKNHVNAAIQGMACEFSKLNHLDERAVFAGNLMACNMSHEVDLIDKDQQNLLYGMVEIKTITQKGFLGWKLLSGIENTQTPEAKEAMADYLTMRVVEAQMRKYALNAKENEINPIIADLGTGSPSENTKELRDAIVGSDVYKAMTKMTPEAMQMLVNHNSPNNEKAIEKFMEQLGGDNYFAKKTSQEKQKSTDIVKFSQSDSSKKENNEKTKSSESKSAKSEIKAGPM